MPVFGFSTQMCKKPVRKQQYKTQSDSKKKKMFLLAENLPVTAGSKQQCSGAMKNWLTEEEEILLGSSCRDKNHLPSPSVLLIYFTFFFLLEKVFVQNLILWKTISNHGC